MKPPLFSYEDPRSLADALDVLARSGDDVSILSGGQSLMPLLNMRLARPEVLLDINRVSGLDGLHVTDDVIEVGALVRARVLERDRAVRQKLPVIGAALSHVGHPQIRARTTVGGNIAHADPSSELPGVLALVDGEVELTSAARGARWVGWDEFFVSVFTTSRESDELLTKVRFPIPQGWRMDFDEFAPRHGDFPIVAVALGTQVREGVLTGLRIAVTGISDRVRRLTETEALARGGRFDGDLVREICTSAQNEVDPTGDSSGSPEYRRYLLGTLLERLLSSAIDSPAA